MKKVLIVLVLSVLISCVYPVYATDTDQFAEISEISDFELYELSDQQKIHVATSKIAYLMELISTNYLGDVSIEQLYESAMRGIIGSLDQYSDYFTEEELDYFLEDVTAEIYGIGIGLTRDDDGLTVVAEVVTGEPADIAGVITGDIILSVNGVDIDNMTLEQVNILIKDKYTDTVRFDVSRDDDLLEFEMSKAWISLQTATVVDFEDLVEVARGKDNSRFGYIKIEQISENTTAELERIFEIFTDYGVTGIALDFRGNPGGPLSAAVDICKLLVPEGAVLYTIDKSGLKTTYTSELERPPFEKIVALTDRNTASAAEIIVAALQDAEAAIVVGEKTYGKGLVQTLSFLDLGDAAKFTTMEYFRRSGARVDGVGVKPNIVGTGITALEEAYRILSDVPE